VLFCDLVDSTALSARLDPEDLRELLRVYHSTAAEAIEAFAGHIARYMGDGVLAYFGYPQAHEQDAQRAVRAALRLVREIEAVPQGLEVRVGIHSGIVVVGEMGSGERREKADIVGETPNIAARLQALAPPNGVLLSEDTERLVRGYFDCQALGAQDLKGLARNVRAFRALGETDAITRLDTTDTSGLTPLVGRERDVETLLDCWRRAGSEGEQVVLLSGEAGIGKSRLAQVLAERIASEPHTRIELRCSPDHESSALFPFTDYLERLLRSRGALTQQDRHALLSAILEEAALPGAFPLLAGLLGLAGPDGPPSQLPPQEQKEQTLDALLALVDARTDEAPLLLIVEDLHWADPSTLEWLGLLVERESPRRLLALLTYRPDFQPPWPLQAHFTAMTLTRLNRAHVEQMVTALSGAGGLTDDALAQIEARTDGVPLFVEELTRSIVEAGLSQPDATVPATLQGSLMARLDRFPGALEVAQVGAVIGREFNYGLLRAVSEMPERQLAEGLSRLVQAGLVVQRGEPPLARYTFKHALIRDAAYDSNLRTARQALHGRVAAALAHEAGASQRDEVIAGHFALAGEHEQAVTHFERAASLALASGAVREAVAHLEHALESLAHCAPGEERDERELAISLKLGPALVAVKGYDTPEVETVFSRCIELSGEAPSAELFLALLGAWVNKVTSPLHFEESAAIAGQLLRLASRHSQFLAMAHFAKAVTHFFAGEVHDSIAEGRRCQDSARGGLADTTLFPGHDNSVSVLDYLALSYHLAGYPESALRTSGEAAQMAAELPQPFLLEKSQKAMFAARLRVLRRDPRDCGRLAADWLSQAAELRVAQHFQSVSFLAAWSSAVSEGGEEAWTAMRDHLATSGPFRTADLSALAEAALLRGRPHLALQAAKEGVDLAKATRREVFLPELLRQQAQALGVTDRRAPSGSEAFLRAAMAVAKEQGARWWELKAARDLARLLHQHGRTEEALNVLRPIYDWFTEGHDLADMREARALLDELTTAV
jgi:class 3 adenylate cyclase